MKQQFVLAHTIRQTEIPALLECWVKNTPFVKILYPQKLRLVILFKKCLFAGILRIGQVVSLFRKTVYRLVTTNCCLMGDLLRIAEFSTLGH